MSKIRWGILGTGRIAQLFAQGLKVVPEAELLGVGSRNLTTAERFAGQFKVPRAYSSYEALVNDSDIDVVYVATPQERHKQDCLLCLNGGKAILCEKPFTLNAQEATEVIALARQKQLFCMEAMWMRFMPLVQRVKCLIDQGEIGTLRCLIADFGYPTPFDPKNRFFAPPGGGALLDRGVYLLSLAFYFLGEPDSIVSQGSFAETGVDEQCSLILNYNQGQQAVLFATLKTYTTNEATIIGDRGKIKLADPFYRPHQFSITPFPQTLPSEGNSFPSFKQKLLDTVKQNYLVQSGYLRVKTYLASRRSQTTVETFRGNGYNFEAEEVINCLKKGQLESKIMPLDETLKIMKKLDLIRSLMSYEL